MDERKQRQRDAIMAEYERRGIQVEQRGGAFLLRGHGVDLRAADLANLAEDDLKPYQPQARGRVAEGDADGVIDYVSRGKYV